MKSVRTENTGPELTVRRILFGMGYRYRLHRVDLPGRPDIVLPKYRTVILVHGCFWHGHRCRYGRLPKSNVSYWEKKIALNRERDRVVRTALMRDGWTVHEIWQCQLSDETRIANRLSAFLL